MSNHIAKFVQLVLGGQSALLTASQRDELALSSLSYSEDDLNNERGARYETAIESWASLYPLEAVLRAAAEVLANEQRPVVQSDILRVRHAAESLWAISTEASFHNLLTSDEWQEIGDAIRVLQPWTTDDVQSVDPPKTDKEKLMDYCRDSLRGKQRRLFERLIEGEASIEDDLLPLMGWIDKAAHHAMARAINNKLESQNAVSKLGGPWIIETHDGCARLTKNVQKVSVSCQ